MGFGAIVRLGCAALLVASVSETVRAQYPRRTDDVVSFQPFLREAPEVQLTNGAAGRLTNLNVNVGAWYVLRLRSPSPTAGPSGTFNLEVPAVPELRGVSVELTREGLAITRGDSRVVCALGSGSEFDRAARGNQAYAPACGDVLYMRKQTAGTVGSWSEWGANILRERLSTDSAERILDLGKTLMAGSGVVGQEGVATGVVPADGVSGRPARARVDARFQNTTLQVPFGIEIQEQRSGGPLLTGAWYAAKNARPGIYFSVTQAGHVDSAILATESNRVDQMVGPYANAAVYLVALDLDNFEVGWSRGVSKPEAGWSSSAEARRFADNRAGPDGFASFEPLASSGVVNPALLPRLAGVMCGGFQRQHGVFRFGPMTQSNFANYWGFMENGVLLSRLNPGLSTLYVTNDGRVDIKTWTEADNQLANLAQLRHARQNGLPLVDGIGPNGIPVPGPVLTGALPARLEGAWSGSASNSFDTPRAGACISEQNGKRFLIYGYFSLGRPSAMARVFQAQGCRNGIHLDMNSASQGYLGLLVGSGATLRTENPEPSMSGANQTLSVGGRNVTVPRYVGRADEVDFFYFLAKSNR